MNEINDGEKLVFFFISEKINRKFQTFHKRPLSVGYMKRRVREREFDVLTVIKNKKNKKKEY